MQFSGKLLLLGCGSVAQCAVPILLKLVDMPASNITIMDFVDNREKVKDALDRGVTYVIDRITRDNYAKLLSSYVSSGDLIIDLAWNIECSAMLEWCRENNVLYVNTSVEQWDPYADEVRTDPTKYTLYARQMKLKKLIESWGDNNGATAIVDHGANPGLVSHFTKKALIDICEKICTESQDATRTAQIEKALQEKAFAQLARLSGVKTIHISERDTQITDQPKQVNEFVNTWSIEGFYEEGIAPAELGWGTHERLIPHNAYFHSEGPKNQICLSTLGIKTWVRSWVPCGEITGMVIRHGEAYSISERLTVWEDGEAVYRPTVHYAYCPCDCAINSLHELEMRQYDLQKDQRIMSDEIISGADELGVLLMGHDFKSWWTGSLLSIDDARQLVPHQNATTMQVAISVVAAAIWMMKNPKRGFCLPDDIDHEEILDISMPYIKPFVSRAVDWTPLDTLNMTYSEFGTEAPKPDDVWQFTSFLTDPRGRALANETVKV